MDPQLQKRIDKEEKYIPRLIPANIIRPEQIENTSQYPLIETKSVIELMFPGIITKRACKIWRIYSDYYIRIFTVQIFLQM